MIDLIREYPDEPVLRSDILSMEALLAAYEGLIRLEGTDMFEAERAFLEELIERGVTDDTYDEEDDLDDEE